MKSKNVKKSDISSKFKKIRNKRECNIFWKIHVCLNRTPKSIYGK